MNKVIRFYNQNRRRIWLVIFVIVFAFLIIQVLNSFYQRVKQEEQQKQNDSDEYSSSDIKNYDNESQSMVQGSITSEKKKQKFGELIEKFLTYCNEGKVSEAYQLLSNSCKKVLYPSEKAFETNYYLTKFEQKKNYEFQLWSAVDQTYVYLIKLYDDMLSSGVATNQSYIQDYFSVIEEDNVYRLSISSLVKNVVYGKEAKQDNITINVMNKDSYMDYEIYHLSISNYSGKTILLDPLLKDDSVYLKDDHGIKYNSMLFESTQEELVLKKGEIKDIDIKFVKSYSTDYEVKELVFTTIIKNYDEYRQNSGSQDTKEIKIELK